MNPTERENAAGALVVAAKGMNMSTIDIITRNGDGSTLFAVQGDPKAQHTFAYVNTQLAVSHSVAQSTQDLAKLAASQSNPQQNTNKHSMTQ